MNFNKSNRPILKVELTLFDKIIEAIAFAIMLITILIVGYYYQKLPETIPTHFNSIGEIDGYGNKTSILGLPIISVLLFIGMSVINKYPHTFNYIGEITLDNAASQYKFATRLVRVLKMIVMIVFLIIVIATINF